MRSNVFAMILSLGTLGVAGCVGVNTGKISGDIGFQSVTPEIAGYFATTSTAAACRYQPLHAFNLNTNALAADSTYTPTTAASFPTLANYEIHPPVADGGTEFRLNLDSICFANAAQYRFGKLGAATAGQFLSGLVLPETTDPAGVTADLFECPATIHANVRLVGDSADIDGIDDPISCSAEARVREDGVFQRQAVSATHTLAEAEIKGSGADLPVVVRGDGSEVQVLVSCTMNTTIPGFPIDISADSFTTGGSSTPVAVSCGDSITADVPIPIERTAGTLEGKIGLGLPGPFQFKVRMEPIGWVTDQNLNTSGLPPYLWRFDSAPAGSYEIEAEILSSNQQVAVGFPHLAAPHSVEVVVDEITDLGNTFVSQLGLISGELSLRDPRPTTALAQLVFNNLSVSNFNSFSTTKVNARGKDGVYFDPETELLGVNGAGAYSRSIPQGNFDPSTGEASLSYSLAIVGLSATDGPGNGSEAQPAPWELESFDIVTGDIAGAYTRASIKPLFTTEYPSTVGVQHDVPDIDVCFGEAALQFVSNQGHNLYGPRMHVRGGTNTSVNDDRGNPILYTGGIGFAQGLPRTIAEASPSVVISATLPAFVQYNVYPFLTLLPASGTSTNVFLEPIPLPSEGGVTCGGVVQECLLLDNEEPMSQLTVSFDSDADFCESDSLSLPVQAQSDTGTIASVEIQLDNQPPVTLCTSCSSPFSTSHSFGTVSAGTHTVRLTAADQSGCEAIQEEVITVSQDPTLVCPTDIEQILGQNQDTLAYADVQDRLQAEWSHSCSSPPLIGDDHPASFPIGETDVTYYPVDDTGTPDLTEACATKVTVKPSNGCSSFEGVPTGNLPDVWAHDRATYTNLSPSYIGMDGNPTPSPQRIIDEYPRNAWGTTPDGKGELTVGGGVRIDLPFAAGWAEVQYDVAHPDQVEIKGFDQNGNLIAEFTSQANLNENRRYYSQVSADGIAYLEMSGGGREAAIHKVCFCHNSCLPGDANFSILPGFQ